MAVLQSTSITGGLVMHGMSVGFMRLNAQGAVVIDTNTYVTGGPYLPLSGGNMTGFIQLSANQLRFDNSGVRSWNIGVSGGSLAINSGDGAGSLLFNGRFLRDSSYRTIAGYSDYYSAGSSGWYRAAEITLTGNCTGAVLYGTLYDHRFDGADTYQIAIVARAECDFTSNNESHYINVGCTILGSTNFTNYRDKIRVVLSASSPNSRTYEVQFQETAWNHDTWQLETTGWTIYSSPQAPRSGVGTPRVNYVSNKNADNIRANNGVFSPHFYDSSNSAFYLDGNVSGGWRLGTPSGTLDFGPLNSSFCHFQTDRDRFYFNKRVEIDGELWRHGGSRFVEANGGTWGINISGIASNSSALNGLSVNQIFNNMGQGHTTRTSFDASTPSYDFGFRFIQGSANGPGTGGTQYYSWYIGLGNDYPATGGGSYGAMFAVDRDVVRPYLSVRYNENNGFGSWRRIAAGFADSSGRVVNGTSTVAGVTFGNTMLATQTASRVVNFDGNGSAPSVWWTNGGTAIGAIDAIGGGGLSFWSNNGSSWQQQVSMTHGTFNVLTTLQQGGNQVWHVGNDGAGSGLDADLLDGVQGNNYFRVDGGYPNTNMDNVVQGYWHVTASDSNLPIAQWGHRWDYDHVKNGQWVVQFYSATSGDQSMWVRQRRNFVSQPWRRMLDSANFNDFAVPVRVATSWNDGTVIDDVIGLMAWKNYGNGHVIFDASQSTSPTGSSVNNTNPTHAWTGTYPTLMGWNGSATYGVRVDSARISDNTSGNSATTSQRSFSGDISTSGQGRFTGWYSGNAATGPAVEAGWSSGEGYVISYNRNNSTYGNLILNAVNIRIDPQGGIATVSGAQIVTNNGGTWGINVTGTAGSETLNTVTSRGNTIDTRSIRFTNASSHGIRWDFSSWTNNAFVRMDNTFDLTLGGHTSIRFITNHLNVGDAVRMSIDMGGTVSVAGTLTAGGDLRAPIFYDSQNTAFYLDPNTTGTSLNIAGQITTSKSGGTIISHGSMSDAFGYNGSYGTYIGSPVGGTYYLYANGTFFDNGAIRTLIHSGNIGSQSVNYANTAGRAYPRRADGPDINFNWAGQGGQPTWLWGSNDGQNFFVWNPSNFSVNYANSAGLVDVPDWRNQNLGPSSFAGHRVGFHFNNTATLGGSSDFWMAVQTVNPWCCYDPSHRQQQLLWGGSGGLSFRFATGTTTWSAWSRIYSDSYRPYADSAGNANTVGGIGAGSFVRNDTYNSANAGLQVFRNIGTTTPSWPDGNHTFGLENSDAGHIVVNFHRAGYTSNNLVYNGSTFSFDMTIVSSGDICAYSDARVKENIITVENALDKVTKMRGVFYNRTDSDDKSRKVGVIAQEMLEVLPEVVNEDNAGMYNVSYGNIAGVLIEAIKEQQAIIEDLKRQIEYLVENK